MGKNINGNEQILLPPADSAAEIERLKGELLIENDKHLRTLADFKNYRRRIERDGSKLAEDNMRGMILPLLGIIDDLEKALQDIKDAKQHSVKGVRLIHEKFLRLLENFGVIPFESIGTLFDHNLHEAVAIVKVEGRESGIVIDELSRGYLRNNELLRPAQVRVTE